MYLSESETENYRKFFDTNWHTVESFCQERFNCGWLTLARQCGESDEQGELKQFYFFARKLKAMRGVQLGEQ